METTRKQSIRYSNTVEIPPYLGSAYLYWRNAARAVLRPNQAVIVTGCDSGLGYSLALHCRSLNAAVIAGVLKPDGLGALDLIRNGVKVVPLDVTRSESIADFGTSVRELMARENLGIRDKAISEK